MTYDEQLKEFYANRSKYLKIKPYAGQWMVYAQTVVPTLKEALKVRG